MKNLYTDLDTAKEDLGTTSLTDGQILRLIDRASREIDSFCGRFFYSETRQFVADLDYNSTEPFLVPLEFDVLSISEVLVDNDGDEDYLDGTLVVGQYILLPRNTFPKTELYVNDYASDRIEIIPQSLKITAKVGFGDGNYGSNSLNLVGTITTEALDTETTLAVSNIDEIHIGQTLLIGTEQVFVSAKGTTDFTVIRGVNSTTPATIVVNNPVYVIEYPVVVSSVCSTAVKYIKEAEDKMGLKRKKTGPYEWEKSAGTESVSLMGLTSAGILSPLIPFRR